MKRNKGGVLFFFLLVSPFIIWGQDHSFSQFYSSPMYLNPSLTGNTECARLSVNYRNQWPSIPAAYNTYQIVYDQSLPSISSGYGIMVYRDSQADGAFTKTHLSGAYSYSVKATEELVLGFGLQGSYLQNSLNWNRLIFADQINIDGTINPGSNETPPPSNNVSMVDFSTGISFDWNNKFYGGVAVHHLNEPVNSFYENALSVLPMKFSAHGGAVFRHDPAVSSKKTLTFSPNLLYQQQGKFHQLNAGLYFQMRPIIIGTWYRHNFENPDAAIILLGLQHQNFKVGYSYDYSLSELSGVSGGAHEVSLSYNFCIYVEKSRKVRAIKCPEF